MDKEVTLRVHLKTSFYNSTKTIRVPRNAKPDQIIKEALEKNHINPGDKDNYEIEMSQERPEEVILRPKGIFGAGTEKSLSEQVFKNPLYGEVPQEDDDEEYGEEDDDDDGEIYEQLEKEKEMRQSAERRALVLEQRVKELESLLEKQTSELDKMKKKRARFEIEMEKLKTQLEVKDEMIQDLQKELEEMQGGAKETKTETQAEWELQNFMHRATFK